MTEEHPVLRVRHRLFGQKRILELMDEKKLDLVLCGHVHKPYLRKNADGRPLEECAGSVTRNGSMVEITLTDGVFSFKTVEL